MTTTLRHYPSGHAEVIETAPDLDVYTSAALRTLTITLTTSGRFHLVLDMTATRFVDTTGLGVLIGAVKRARVHGGSLGLACLQEQPLRALRVSGLARVMPVHETLAEALAAVPAETEAAAAAQLEEK